MAVDGEDRRNAGARMLGTIQTDKKEKGSERGSERE
jgi:hypothetical protein